MQKYFQVYCKGFCGQWLWRMGKVVLRKTGEKTFRSNWANKKVTEVVGGRVVGILLPGLAWI